MCLLPESCRRMPFCHAFLLGLMIMLKQDEEDVFVREEPRKKYFPLLPNSVWRQEEGSWKNPRERKRRRWEGEGIREPPKLPKPPNQAPLLELDPSLVHHLRAEKQSRASEKWERRRKAKTMNRWAQKQGAEEEDCWTFTENITAS